MRIAITSESNSLNSKLDQRFGRCAYLVIYDSETQSVEFIPNPNMENIEGAGPATVNLIASKGVTKVVSGEFGDKVKAIFDSLQIQLIILKDPGKTIAEIIKLLNH
ncbi:MAG: NifB/NifX family molybdenum-iron cluster-binding protein [Prolixibacteraceae bacterium]|jgi:predicted Fe-Mo cluster-binding NifX family protein